MRTIPAFRFGLIGAIALISAMIAARSTTAAEPQQATVTQIVNDVKLLPTGGAAKPATINDRVADGTAVQTGMDSRTELTLADQALARLSPNTIFNFKGTRDLDLADGAVLLRVPKKAGAAKISTAAVTAAVTGTTVIVEYHPHGYIKFISLEGTARLYLKHRWGESVLVRAGQMLITNPDAKSLPDPVDVDLDRLLKTARLIVDFSPLESRSSIAKESEKQQQAKSKRRLIDTNLVIFGKGTLVSLTNPLQKTATSRPVDDFIPGSEAVPSSTDLGTVEKPPSPDGSSPANYTADHPR
jgi:hypothetical protein